MLSLTASKRFLGAAVLSVGFSIIAGPASAQVAQVGPFDLTSVISACALQGNTTCVIGDKSIWDVSYTGPAALESQIQVSGLQVGNIYSIDANFQTFGGITAENAPTGLSIGYAIEIIPGSPFTFAGVQLASQGAVQSPSTASVTKDVYDFKGGVLLTSLNSFDFDAAPGGGAFDDAVKGLTSFYVVDSYLVTGANASIFAASNTYIQRPNVDTVPGPLPLLGAAAAFGYSRKLRARISSKNAII